MSGQQVPPRGLKGQLSTTESTCLEPSPKARRVRDRAGETVLPFIELPLRNEGREIPGGRGASAQSQPKSACLMGAAGISSQKAANTRNNADIHCQPRSQIRFLKNGKSTPTMTAAIATTKARQPPVFPPSCPGSIAIAVLTDPTRAQHIPARDWVNTAARVATDPPLQEQVPERVSLPHLFTHAVPAGTRNLFSFDHPAVETLG